MSKTPTSQRFRNLISKLEVDCRTYNTQKVVDQLHTLLVYGGLVEKELGEHLAPTMVIDSTRFLLEFIAGDHMPKDTAPKLTKTQCGSWRAYYALLWAASKGMEGYSLRIQAAEYLNSLGNFCHKYLEEHTVHAAKRAATPAKPLPPYLRVVPG